MMIEMFQTLLGEALHRLLRFGAQPRQRPYLGLPGLRKGYFTYLKAMGYQNTLMSFVNLPATTTHMMILSILPAAGLECSTSHLKRRLWLLPKKVDIPFKMKRFPRKRYFVYKRVGKRWVYVYSSKNVKSAENKLADLWADFLGTEI